MARLDRYRIGIPRELFEIRTQPWLSEGSLTCDRSLKCAVNTRVGVEWEQPLLTKCPNGYAPHTASDSKVLTLPSRGGTVSTKGERRKARHWRSNQLLWTDGVHQLKRQFI